MIVETLFNTASATDGTKELWRSCKVVAFDHKMKINQLKSCDLYAQEQSLKKKKKLHVQS